MSNASQTETVMRVIARQKTDRKAIVQIIPISPELMVEEGEASKTIVNALSREVWCQIRKVSSHPCEITSIIVAEREPVKRVLTQEEFDDDPQWAEWGFKAGDKVSDYIYWGSVELDKHMLDVEGSD